MGPRTRSLLLTALVVAALAVGARLVTGGQAGPVGTEARPTATAGVSVGLGGASVDPVSGLPVVDVASLPPEAGQTLALIDAGGPFPHDEDGEVFQNREGVLPDRGYGYYHEYTVETPGSDDRGARRIVTGDEGEYYWTEDHYQSFERIQR
ncbi:MAG TPA: ribonuclease domain-containing protein [Nocardioides sp.]|uniref:ribonuclease domain-containing protein n=1 Tax=Nocardioides sp. TaxID=35761 RepID=UPI002CB6E769|nr:ribonuclease domain-containing protein [Nocardioides sp.]HQR26899.1 ribonuclease domain-containing protein [Nocardioides sp.]